MTLDASIVAVVVTGGALQRPATQRATVVPVAEERAV